VTEEKFLTHFNVSASALTTERLKMRLIANNMANINTTRTASGGPYQRMEALVKSKQLTGNKYDRGVSVDTIAVDQGPPKLVYDPAHPDANTSGYVAYPNIDLVTETTKLKQASLAYEANAAVISTIKKSIDVALDLAKEKPYGVRYGK